jgi:hypothetical protein
MGQFAPGMREMTSNLDNSNEEKTFGEFRRKVKSAEVLSASVERLLLALRFTGELSVTMKNGRVHKSRYEEYHYRGDFAGPSEGFTQKA